MWHDVKRRVGSAFFVRIRRVAALGLRQPFSRNAAPRLIQAAGRGQIRNSAEAVSG